MILACLRHPSISYSSDLKWFGKSFCINLGSGYLDIIQTCLRSKRQRVLVKASHDKVLSPNSLANNTYPMTIRPPTINLFLLIQLWPASRAAWPPSTTAPKPAPLPPSLLLSAAVSGEHALEAGAFGSGTVFPVAGSIRLDFIHFQFSSSNSGHSALNLTPPSPALTAPMPFVVAVTPGTDLALVPPPVEFHQRVLPAAHFRSASVA